MLRRMYLKWFDKKNFTYEIISEHKGEEAGIKSSTLKVNGDYIYGLMKNESGVHRLVRISPFDSGARRHTSFASIWVYPDIDDEIDIKIDEKDLRIDIFRASGPGGQSVNTTDSAVRIVHIPTNITVSQQDEKSQHKNREKAMKILRARLYEAERARLEAERSADRKDQVGSGDRSERIRTYNFPQGRVSEHRTNMTLYKIDNIVNDGELDEIIDALIANDQAKRLAATN